jgi:hypothetical protein
MSYIDNMKQNVTSMLFLISGFLREVYENCALLGYYAASSGNLLPTFRDKLSIPFSGVKKPKEFLTSEDGTDGLSRKVSKKLPLLAA